MNGGEIPQGWQDWLTSRRTGKKRTETVQNLPAYVKARGGGMVERALGNLREATAAIEDVVAALAAIPNPDIGWDAWNRVLMAVWAATEGSEAGLAAAVAWSAKSRKHDGEAVRERWAHYSRSPPTEIGFGALVWAAREAVPGWEMPSRRTRPAIEGTKMNGHANELFAGPLAASSIVFPDVDKFKKPKPTCANGIAAIRGLGINGEYDVFHNKLRIGGRALGQWAGDFVDNAIHHLRTMCRETYKLDVGTTHMNDAVIQLCIQNTVDPITNYLASLQWDGVKRIETWMVRYLGAEDTPFNREVSRLSLLAAVRRARQPGCKFDQIIMLEGPEGRGKSSAIEIMAGRENFSDSTILSLDDKGQQEAVAGVWLYEIADMAGHGKAEVEKVKAFVSRTCDRARPAYGRNREDRLRRCIFFGTTNNNQYLKSQTGNRRFWPVVCGRIDLEALGTDRDQLWAEAAVLEAQGSSISLAEKLWPAAAELQDARRDHDPWDDKLSGTLGHVFAAEGGGYEWRVTTEAILGGTLALSSREQTDAMYKRAAFVMRRLGWDGPHRIRYDGGVRLRGYIKPATEAEWKKYASPHVQPDQAEKR